MRTALLKILEMGTKKWFVSLRENAVVQVILGSLFLGLFAQIEIPLFFTPVPITGQTLAVMLLGVAIGRVKGTLAVLFYLVQGCLGLPLWAGGGFGLLSFAGPTGGYFVGFVVQAYLTGYLIERMKGFGFVKVFWMMLIPSLLQLGIGTLWLTQFVGWSNAPILGFYPFLIGDVMKVSIATMAVKVRENRLSLPR